MFYRVKKKHFVSTNFCAYLSTAKIVKISTPKINRFTVFAEKTVTEKSVMERQTWKHEEGENSLLLIFWSKIKITKFNKTCLMTLKTC